MSALRSIWASQPIPNTPAEAIITCVHKDASVWWACQRRKDKGATIFRTCGNLRGYVFPLPNLLPLQNAGNRVAIKRTPILWLTMNDDEVEGEGNVLSTTCSS
ncbi:hypothetical protein [Fervidibacter sacchari]